MGLATVKLSRKKSVLDHLLHLNPMDFLHFMGLAITVIYSNETTSLDSSK